MWEKSIQKSFTPFLPLFYKLEMIKNKKLKMVGYYLSTKGRKNMPKSLGMQERNFKAMRGWYNQFRHGADHQYIRNFQLALNRSFFTSNNM